MRRSGAACTFGVGRTFAIFIESAIRSASSICVAKLQAVSGGWGGSSIKETAHEGAVEAINQLMKASCVLPDVRHTAQGDQALSPVKRQSWHCCGCAHRRHGDSAQRAGLIRRRARKCAWPETMGADNRDRLSVAT